MINFKYGFEFTEIYNIYMLIIRIHSGFTTGRKFNKKIGRLGSKRTY